MQPSFLFTRFDIECFQRKILCAGIIPAKLWIYDGGVYLKGSMKIQKKGRN